jgi:acetyl esterase/lipase
MASLRARLFTKLLRWVRLKRVLGSPDAIGRAIAADRRRGPARPPPRLRARCHVSLRQVAGRPVWELSPRGREPLRHLLYLHGGGFVLSIQPPHWQLIGRLVERLGCAVTVPLYPLAPEHDAADARDFLLGIYRDLAGGLPARRPLVLIGDSAGGNLALALAVQAREQALPAAAAVVLLSPAVDMSGQQPPGDELDRLDPILSLAGLPHLVELYCRRVERTDSWVSPLLAPLAGLPPVALFAGSHDVLYADALRLADKARAEGAPVTLYAYPDMVHVWPLFPIPEGRRAVDEIVAFIRSAG